MRKPVRSSRNPLVRWDRRYEGTVGSGDYYYGPMLKADAEEKFRASMATSDRVLTAKGLLPLPLSFIIRAAPGREGDDAWRAEMDYAERVAAETQSVALLEFVYGRTSTRAPMPGSPSRETPHTLFNALHRLCEFITLSPSDDPSGPVMSPDVARSGNIGTLPCMSAAVSHNLRVANELMVNASFYLADLLPKKGHPLLGQTGNQRDALRALYCSGLNTASGRLGAVDDGDQALAEAFAKFCLSMDAVYDPAAPLMLEGRPVDLPTGWGSPTEYLQNIRAIWGRILTQTVFSVCNVFGLFVRGYYSGTSPTELLEEGQRPRFEHMGIEYEDLNNYIPKGMTDRRGQRLSFVRPSAFNDTTHAAALYRAVKAHIQPGRDELREAEHLLHRAIAEITTGEQRKTLGLRDMASVMQFLRQRYEKPKHTLQAMDKSRRIMAAIKVSERGPKPTVPGLHAVFIQPQE